jgi:hypothetical protein
MGSGELRYWSFCSNQGFANTRVNDCVHDENVPVGPDGYYAIVVSRAADRPRNAIAQCGIAWLPMADDGLPLRPLPPDLGLRGGGALPDRGALIDGRHALDPDGGARPQPAASAARANATIERACPSARRACSAV